MREKSVSRELSDEDDHPVTAKHDSVSKLLSV